MNTVHHFDENNMKPLKTWDQSTAPSSLQKSHLGDGIKELFEEGIIEEYTKP